MKSLPLVLIALTLCSDAWAGQVSLRHEFAGKLRVLADTLLELQDKDSASATCGALYCQACADHHTRASEAVLPFAVAYRETGDEKYLTAAIATGNWLIDQQQPNGSWLETPSDWTGTTTD